MGFEQRLNPTGNKSFPNRTAEGFQILETGRASHHSRHDGSEHAKTTRIKASGRESWRQTIDIDPETIIQENRGLVKLPKLPDLSQFPPMVLSDATHRLRL